MNEVDFYGVPSTILLPASREGWKYVSGPHVLDVGFHSLHGAGLVGYGLAEDVHVMVDMGNITKALYESGLYPYLMDNQVFSIRNILIDNDKETVSVVGHILERV